MDFKTLGYAFLGADDEAGNIIAKMVSGLTLTVEEGRACVEALKKNPNLYKDWSTFIRNSISPTPRQETFADENGVIILPLLLSQDQLIETGSKKVFEVKSLLNTKKDEYTFELESVEKRHQMMIVHFERLPSGYLQLTGFEKHIPRPEL